MHINFHHNLNVLLHYLASYKRLKMTQIVQKLQWSFTTLKFHDSVTEFTQNRVDDWWHMTRPLSHMSQAFLTLENVSRFIFCLIRNIMEAHRDCLYIYDIWTGISIFFVFFVVITKVYCNINSNFWTTTESLWLDLRDLWLDSRLELSNWWLDLWLGCQKWLVTRRLWLVNKSASKYPPLTCI